MEVDGDGWSWISATFGCWRIYCHAWLREGKHMLHIQAFILAFIFEIHHCFVWHIYKTGCAARVDNVIIYIMSFNLTSNILVWRYYKTNLWPNPQQHQKRQDGNYINNLPHTQHGETLSMSLCPGQRWGTRGETARGREPPICSDPSWHIALIAILST